MGGGSVMGGCGVCTYLAILETTDPSDAVRRIMDEIRAEHECDTQLESEPRAHPDTMIGRR